MALRILWPPAASRRPTARPVRLTLLAALLLCVACGGGDGAAPDTVNGGGDGGADTTIDAATPDVLADADSDADADALDVSPSPDTPDVAPDLRPGDVQADGGDVPAPPCRTDDECDDGDPCTDDECAGAFGCVSVPRSCDDGDRCTTDRCLPESGVCDHGPLTCDDGNPCTTDACDAQLGCTHALLDCDDGDPCTVDGCSRDTGCTNVLADCDDGDACTQDACDPGDGSCLHTPVGDGCCNSDGDCGDADVCTDDRCVDNVCSYVAVGDPDCCNVAEECDDGNPCTDDLCAGNRCHHEPVGGPDCCGLPGTTCDDGDGCTVDTCVDFRCLHDELPGCCRSAAECDDGDPCTTDSCEGTPGACRHVAQDGCCNVDRDCDDYDPCTEDTCPTAGGPCQWAPVADCCVFPADCPALDPDGACLTSWCLDHACVAAARCCAEDNDCDDGDPCTEGVCVEGGCQYMPSDAPCCLPTLARARFDGEDGWDWELDDLGAPFGWHVSDTDALSAPASLRYGDPDAAGYAAALPTSGEARSPALALPAEATVTLRFAVFVDVEDDLDYDRIAVLVRVLPAEGEEPVEEETGDTEVWSKTDLDAYGSWRLVTVALDAWAGQTVRLVARFDSVDTIGNTTGGVWLDDLRVDSACAAEPTRDAL